MDSCQTFSSTESLHFVHTRHNTFLNMELLFPLRCLKLKLKLIYDRQSVSQSVLVSGAHLGPVTNFSFALKFPSDICVLLFCSALSDERTGL
jgi:hypothetical protein